MWAALCSPLSQDPNRVTELIFCAVDPSVCTCLLLCPRVLVVLCKHLCTSCVQWSKPCEREGGTGA